ncbi:MAG: GtrA family protein [Prevotellaceae bacterium]|nr:GtrA family protein [Prevotellaceae bacterium]
MVLFAKAQVSAVVATCVDFGLTILLAQCFGVYYFYATMIGAISGGVTNCVINYKYVFEDAHQHKRSVAIKYLEVWLGSIALNTFGTYALTELLHIHFLFPKVVVAILVAVLWNYQLQRFYVYRNCHTEKLFHRYIKNMKE